MGLRYGVGMAKIVPAIMLAVSMLACARDETSLRTLRLWEGAPDCATCRAAALDLLANSNPVLSLKQGRTYTLEATLQLGSQEDRCLYRMATPTWRFDALPREFKCFPPAPTRVETIPATRDATGPPPADGERLTVAVREYDVTTRERVADLFDRVYQVRFD
jgi:hypothetical protein